MNIDRRVKGLAKELGVQIRCADTPRKAKIITKIPKDIIAAYVGKGIVYVRTPITKDKEYMSIVVLHEIGHAVLDFFDMNNPVAVNENMANAIALGFAAKFRLPIRNDLLKDLKKMMKGKL